MNMAIEEITYEEFMDKLDEIEKRYLSDEEGRRKDWRFARNSVEK